MEGSTSNEVPVPQGQASQVVPGSTAAAGSGHHDTSGQAAEVSNTMNGQSPVVQQVMDVLPLRSACESCRRLKQKCSGGQPCDQCVRSGNGHTCAYLRCRKSGRPPSSLTRPETTGTATDHSSGKTGKSKLKKSQAKGGIGRGINSSKKDGGKSSRGGIAKNKLFGKSKLLMPAEVGEGIGHGKPWPGVGNDLGYGFYRGGPGYGALQGGIDAGYFGNMNGAFSPGVGAGPVGLGGVPPPLSSPNGTGFPNFGMPPLSPMSAPMFPWAPTPAGTTGQGIHGWPPHANVAQASSQAFPDSNGGRREQPSQKGQLGDVSSGAGKGAGDFGANSKNTHSAKGQRENSRVRLGDVDGAGAKYPPNLREPPTPLQMGSMATFTGGTVQSITGLTPGSGTHFDPNMWGSAMAWGLPFHHPAHGAAHIGIPGSRGGERPSGTERSMQINNAGTSNYHQGPNMGTANMPTLSDQHTGSARLTQSGQKRHFSADRAAVATDGEQESVSSCGNDEEENVDIHSRSSPGSGSVSQSQPCNPGSQDPTAQVSSTNSGSLISGNPDTTEGLADGQSQKPDHTTADEGNSGWVGTAGNMMNSSGNWGYGMADGYGFGGVPHPSTRLMPSPGYFTPTVWGGHLDGFSSFPAAGSAAGTPIWGAIFTPQSRNVNGQPGMWAAETVADTRSSRTSLQARPEAEAPVELPDDAEGEKR